MIFKNSENITQPPSDDAYAVVSTLFTNKRFKDHEIAINSLSLAVIDLISKGQIKCEISHDESHEVKSKLTSDDLEVMKSITLRIANSGELKTSETKAINLLKKMNKSKKFNLKDMLKLSAKTAIANAFGEDYEEFRNALESENGYSSTEYRDILKNSKLTTEGKDLKRKWKDYQNYLKSDSSSDDLDVKLIYGACFDIEREVLDSKENCTSLSDFIDKDGYKFLNIIFNKAASNVSEKRRGDGIFYGVNDKYTIPGGG
jgi:hypothetical protein